MTRHTLTMKIAISLPDDLFREVEACSDRLKVTRSKFFVLAARAWLARQSSTDPTEAWNRAIAEGGQPGDDPGARAARRRSKGVVRATARRRR